MVAPEIVLDRYAADEAETVLERCSAGEEVTEVLERWVGEDAMGNEEILGDWKTVEAGRMLVQEWTLGD